MEKKYYSIGTKKTVKNTVSESAEAVYLKGRKGVSDRELLANIANISLEKASELLQHVNFRLDQIASMTIDELLNFKGIGINKAAAIISAFELSSRRYNIEPLHTRKICRSQDIYEIMKPYFIDEPVEHMYCIVLNRNNKIISIEHVSKGGYSSTVVDPAVVVKKILDKKGTAFVLSHNHPSNNTKPSEQDRRLTLKFKNIAELINLTLLDHVIYTDNSYFSFADEGLI